MSLASAVIGDLTLTNTSGCALLFDMRRKRLLVTRGAVEASEWVAPPGSTVKPLSLWALLRSGRLKPEESFGCPGRLLLAGINMSCSHPPLPFPVNATLAITYSCNCAAAHFAQRFRGDELASFFAEFGLGSATHLLPHAENSGHIQQGITGQQLQLQALGERGIRVTPLGLADTYRRLAALSYEPRFVPILEGLEGAVEVGTGQAARVPGTTVAGKTGSIRMDSGLHAAWFAGFAPSRRPEVVVTVLTQGTSGASAAAPIAGDLLREYFSNSVRL
ncbi:MAG TPA: penicillin-binding transpeptidase domain-containing protein [Bryobacteraceae bacterium]|nr:penicillin-binding transpeptidase domain-containing protein [Bryobacteraceae bacterium]